LAALLQSHQIVEQRRREAKGEEDIKKMREQLKQQNSLPFSQIATFPTSKHPNVLNLHSLEID
jgi:hypothetical protein